jgi:hypothetical protein
MIPLLPLRASVSRRNRAHAGRALEQRELSVAGTKPLLSKARAMEQREVLGYEIALINAHLLDDLP